MSETVIILNRAAGGGKCADAAGPALQRLSAHFPALEVHWTDYPGHATELARIARQEGANTVLVAGGDGTVFEVINGLFPNTHGTCTLGILPLGTGNSFLRDFGITDAEQALQAILRGDQQAIDVIRAEHTEGELHYINLLSIGFSAQAGALTNRRFKGLGLGGYALAVVASIVRLAHPKFAYRTSNNAAFDGPSTLLSFSNSRYTGGTMEMAPAADPSDGLLDIIHIGPMSRRRLLTCFPKIYQGTHVHLEEIAHQTTNEVVFSMSSPTDVMVDGEVLELCLNRLSVIPSALKVLR